MVMLLEEEEGAECIRVHHKNKKDNYNVRYLHKEPNVFVKFFLCLHICLWNQVTLFKIRSVGETFVWS